MSQDLVLYKNLFYDSTRWNGFRLREDDIVISTPPKCGTTWTQRICALLIFQSPRLDKPLTTYSPWIDILTQPIGDVVAELDAQTHRRFIKTHTPFDGIPYDPRVTYLCVGRDPRDVALSWDGHMANMDFPALLAARGASVGNEDIAEIVEQGPPPLPESLRERFWMWMDDPTPATETASSLLATLHHLHSFWKVRERPNVVFLHYADLKADLEGEMRRLASHLGIRIAEDRWPELVKAATFEEMKRDADRTAPGVTEAIWQQNSGFFRAGSLGEWTALFEEGDQERYSALVRGFVEDEDFAAWAHGGRRRS
jgi:aryl sulfotransferase